MQTPNFKLLNWPLVITVVVLIGLGYWLGYFMHTPPKEVEYNHIVQENAKLDSLYQLEVERSNQLQVEIDTLNSLRNEDLIIIKGLKEKRDEKIDNLDTMSHNDLYDFFSGR